MELIFLCIKIFFIRIIDVSLGTLSTIIVVKGKSLEGSIIGFFQILLWFLIVKEALNYVADTFIINFIIGISYALGYAVGTYVGSILSKKFINSVVSIQIITDKFNEITNELRKIGYGVSIIEIEGYDKEIDRKMLLVETNSNKIYYIKKIINNIDKKAFIVINESTMVINGIIN